MVPCEFNLCLKKEKDSCRRVGFTGPSEDRIHSDTPRVSREMSRLPIPFQSPSLLRDRLLVLTAFHQKNRPTPGVLLFDYSVVFISLFLEVLLRNCEKTNNTA